MQYFTFLLHWLLSRYLPQTSANRILPLADAMLISSRRCQYWSRHRSIVIMWRVYIRGQSRDGPNLYGALFLLLCQFWFFFRHRIWTNQWNSKRYHKLAVILIYGLKKRDQHIILNTERTSCNQRRFLRCLSPPETFFSYCPIQQTFQLYDGGQT